MDTPFLSGKYIDLLQDPQSLLGAPIRSNHNHHAMMEDLNEICNIP